jgi:hypothetical protein
MVSRTEWDDSLAHRGPRREANGDDGCRGGSCDQLEHRLRVALSINEDAQRAWTDLWNEVRHLATPDRLAAAKAQGGPGPACGWPEFVEKMSILKHYLDCGRRICHERT